MLRSSPCSPTSFLVAGEGGIVATNNDDLAEHIRGSGVWQPRRL